MALAGGLRLIVSQRLVPASTARASWPRPRCCREASRCGTSSARTRPTRSRACSSEARRSGIIRLDDSLADLVRAGKVTLEEAKGYAEAPDELAAIAGGQRAPALVVEAPKPAQGARELASGLLSRAGSLMGKKGP